MQFGSDCSICKHFFGNKKCRAFPGGIPKNILIGQVRHINPYKDDNGIMFEPIDGYDNDFNDDFDDEEH